MSAFENYELRDNNFLLTTERSIYWQEEKILIMSDLHLGKAGHFRKSGIAIPQSLFKEDMHRLVTQIQYFKPEVLLIVGDLFHSTMNKELDFFLKWRNDFDLNIILVKGNHDILKKEWYQKAGIIVHASSYSINNFTFTHDIECCEQDSNYCFSGHIHPGVSIRGIGKQLVRLPCFYFSESYAVLPAFGKFTGNHIIHPHENDSVFAIAGEEIIRIQ